MKGAGYVEGRVHHHHRPDHPVKPSDARDVAVIDPPENLQATIDPLYGRAAPIQWLELLRRPREHAKGFNTTPTPCKNSYTTQATRLYGVLFDAAAYLRYRGTL